MKHSHLHDSIEKKEMPKLDDAEFPKILGFFTITPFESASQLVTESELPAPLFASTIQALIRSSRATLVRPGSWMVMKEKNLETCTVL